MDKSGQRKSQEVKSHLNLLRETFVFICSLLLWIYCAVVIVTFSTILLQNSNYLTQVVLTVLKVDYSDINAFFIVTGVCMLIITVYLFINYRFNKYKENMHEDFYY